MAFQGPGDNKIMTCDYYRIIGTLGDIELASFASGVTFPDQGSLSCWLPIQTRESRPKLPVLLSCCDGMAGAIK